MPKPTGKGREEKTATHPANEISSAVKCVTYLFLYATLPVERVLVCDRLGYYSLLHHNYNPVKTAASVKLSYL